MRPARAPEVLELLAGGELRVLGLLTGASNYTFLAEISDGSQSVPAVYKPRAGEAPLWDFPRGSLHRREVAAFHLAEALGWPAVPPTVVREGPHGVGAVQAFVDADPDEHFFTLRASRLEDFAPVAAFDVVANNADRKSGHCLLGRDGTIWCIDHGLCFGTLSPLRTVIWEFAGLPVPEPLLRDLRRLSGELRAGPLRESLEELLATEEVDATAERAEELARAGTFPVPSRGRNHPWPLV